MFFGDTAHAVSMARRMVDISQEELARRSGISQKDISRIDSGSSNVTVKTLMRLAEAMDLRVIVRFLPKINRDQLGPQTNHTKR